jgi:hypothetical protein
MNSSLPQWNVRLDASRHGPHGFSDLASIVAHHYRLHALAAEFLGPYNARQRAATHYTAPEKEHLKKAIRQGHVNDFSYLAFINSLVTFCERTKGLRALPTPHPSVIHSIQLPRPAFELHPGEKGDTIVEIAGADLPLTVKAVRNASDMKFIIVRPKLSRLGTASANSWEVLFFSSNHGYIPDWADTNLNPRYSGCF